MKTPASMIRHIATNPVVQCVPWGIILLEIDYRLNVLPKRYRKERLRLRMIAMGQECNGVERQRQDRRRVWNAQKHAIEHRRRRRRPVLPAACPR